MAARKVRMLLLAGAAVLGACAAAVPAVAQEWAEWAPEMGIDEYAWIDRADVLGETIGSAPPDYAFSFDGGEPMAWMLDDGSLVIVEELDDGLHSYYFDPDFDAPFLIRDPEMSFAFVHGQVAVVYGADGEVLSRDEGEEWLDVAIDAYARGEDIRRAWLRRDERPVAASVWLDLSFVFYDSNQRWEEGRRRHWGWRRWREGRASIDYRRGLWEERRRREEMAERFRNWRAGNWQGRPPGRWQRPPEGWRPGTRPSRPGRPGEPGTRPDRPREPGRPGTRPDRPDRPGGTQPGTSQPGTRPDRPGRPSAGSPVTPPNRPARPGTRPRPEAIDGTRPDRPRRPVVAQPDRRPEGALGSRPSRPSSAPRPVPVREGAPGSARPRPEARPGPAPRPTPVTRPAPAPGSARPGAAAPRPATPAPAPKASPSKPAPAGERPAPSRRRDGETRQPN